MQIPFSKLHGLGNDFVFIDDFSRTLVLSPEQVALLCDRHFGVGADGVILVRPSQREECSAYMHYINSDGTLAEMCGNGIRCFAKFLYDHGYLNEASNSFVADTKRGPLSLTFTCDDEGAFDTATVDMDEPIFDPARIPTALPASSSSFVPGGCVQSEELDSPWGTFAFTCVSMGNPHAICFLDNMDQMSDECFVSSHHSLETLNVDKIGSYFESHETFPAKCNIEFIEMGSDGLHMRVYERGCGETLACGTGACASLVASVLTGRSKRENFVHLRGGTLAISWDTNNHVYMTGPARQSFTGVVEV